MLDAYNKKFKKLKLILKELKSVVVAYSGGVDSTFLLKSAVDTLGADNVLACMSVGPSESRNMFEKAVEFAGSINWNERFELLCSQF
jgi:uncharacterized protein